MIIRVQNGVLIFINQTPEECFLIVILHKEYIIAYATFFITLLFMLTLTTETMRSESVFISLKIAGMSTAWPVVGIVHTPLNTHPQNRPYLLSQTVYDIFNIYVLKFNVMCFIYWLSIF